MLPSEKNDSQLQKLEWTEYKNHRFHGNKRFLTEEGQFHEKCHGREIVN